MVRDLITGVEQRSAMLMRNTCQSWIRRPDNKVLAKAEVWSYSLYVDDPSLAQEIVDTADNLRTLIDNNHIEVADSRFMQ